MLRASDGSPTDGFQGINREHGEDDPIGAETVTAPATVSGEPAANSDHWETGKVGVRRGPVSQETCHRDAAMQAFGRGRPMNRIRYGSDAPSLAETVYVDRMRGHSCLARSRDCSATAAPISAAASSVSSAF